MYTVLGNGMPRKKPVGPVVNFQLKLYGEEAERWLKIRDQAKKRNNYIGDTGINRRLLGLDPDKAGEVTERDRAFFLGPQSSKPAEMLGRTPSGKAHIKDVSPKVRHR
jgi:hypothetical protein